MNWITQTGSKHIGIVKIFLWGLLIVGTNAWAELPQIEPPSTTVGTGFMGVVQGHFADFIKLFGLLIAAITLIVIAKNTIAKYSDVANGRGTMAEVALHVGVGIVLLVIVVWLMNEAATILT